MKKYLYPALITLTLFFVVLIFIFAKPTKKNIPPYIERQGSISLAGEWLNTKKAIEGLIQNLEINPNDNKSKLALAQAYIQESRITGNHSYYDKASLDLLDEIIKQEQTNFDALCCKATVLLSQHHFDEGLLIAKNALLLDTNNSFIYGILCDANVELGNYTEAIKMGDKMNSIKPDIRSYARISYLREIHGDVTGAISAMKLAVNAGYPGLEQTEWCCCVLGHLYENIGSLDSAEFCYKSALQNRPSYAFAIAGLGKIEQAKGNYNAAIKHFENAKSLIEEYSFSDELTDLYKLNKNYSLSEKYAQEVIKTLQFNEGDESTNNHGHYADRELALAYLKINDFENALKHATIEYNRRPNNIDVCETIAWVKYKMKKFNEANNYIDKALKTKSKNPVLLCRAGLIKVNCGNPEVGKEFIKTALSSNPFLNNELKLEAQKYLSL